MSVLRLEIFLGCLVANVLFGVFGANAEPKPYTVRLARQQLPLHSEGGVVQFKSAYHGTISIGKPNPQVLDVVFDTGSGHLVLPSALCKSPTCLRHVRYRRRGSRSAVDIDGDGSEVGPGQPRDQLTVSYGTGEITGIFVRDQVCLGKRTPVKEPARGASQAVEASSLLQTKVKQTHVAKVTELPDDELDEEGEHGCSNVQFVAALEMTENPFSSFGFDGVLGLGLVGLSQTPAFNFFDVASQSDAWQSMPGFERVFSVFLGTSNSEASTITFGGYQPQHVEGDSGFAWHEIHNPDDGYWQIKLFEITANGKRLDFCDDGTCRAVVDTGTSLLTVPSAIGSTLIRTLRHENTPGYHCNGPGPSLELDLGNITVKLDPADIFRPEFVSDKTAQSSRTNLKLGSLGGSVPAESSEMEPSHCVPMLMYLDLPDPLSRKTFILGEPVLQKYLAAFNTDPVAPSVGFAIAKHTGERERLRFVA